MTMANWGKGAGLVGLCATMMSAQAEVFKDGERAAFFGDSVTHHGYWVKPLQDFYYTRFPKRDIHIWNCGVGGETSTEATRRVEADIAWRKPTFVNVCFGMNDVGVVGYQTNAPSWALDQRRNAPSRFEAGMRKLHALLQEKAPGARICWCTLVPWDDELQFKPPRGPITGVTEGERPLSDFVTSFRKEVGGDYVDFYGPMLAYNRKLHKTDPYSSLSPDTIHPKEPGGLFMLRLFLAAQGADGVVSEVVVDAAAGKATQMANADVTGIAKTSGGGVAFRVSEKSLPFPVDPAARAMADEIGFDNAFNRELLRVTGLTAGDWILRIDGRDVVTNSAAAWAKGVNLATVEATPMMAQSRTVAAKNAEKMAKEKEIRSLWVARCVAWRRMFWDAKFTDADFADDRFPLVYASAYLAACAKCGKKGLSDQKMYEKFKQDWSSVRAREAEIEKLHRAVRGLCVPQPHGFELVAVSPGA